MWLIGQRLREQRERRKLTLGQVAAFEECSINYLSKLERGINQPNLWPFLGRLARRYHTSVDYILGLTDDPSPMADRQSDPPDLVELVALLRQVPLARRREVRAILEALRVFDDESRLSLDEAVDKATGRAPDAPHIVGDVDE